MSIKIEKPKDVRLVEEVAMLTGESELTAIRKALLERRGRMLRAPCRSQVLAPEEVEELLNYAPRP